MTTEFSCLDELLVLLTYSNYFVHKGLPSLIIQYELAIHSDSLSSPEFGCIG